MNDQRKTSRREFLRGKSAVAALTDLADGVAGPVAGEGHDPGPPPTPAAFGADPSGYLLQVERAAMACRFQACLNAGQYPEGPQAALQALDLVESLEDQMTVYREHSEISSINRRAAQESVSVEPELFGLLEQAVDLCRATSGAFDITSTPLTRVWGFFRRQGRLPPPAEVTRALAQVGSRWLQLDPDRKTVHFQQPGVEINLNAIGKGYALDRCGALLRDAGIHDFLWHGGQSSVLASGSRAGRGEQDAGWLVAVRHPLRADRRLAEVLLRDRALATSGSANQFFHHRGRRYCHVLDPRTGWPAEGVLSATVLAPTAALADALATALFVMGLEPARLLVESRRDLAALLVCPGRRAGSLQTYAIGSQQDQWRLVQQDDAGAS